ncbi:MAG: ABC transporter ATP-binding protein [Desulfobacteraceae bacterium]|nr:ABC transporter ATP-binding protein [Desulfobacteraceae bacterium]
MAVILKCNALGFRYGKTQILRDISFDVEPGLFYAILGKNGSGKTTLLHCLNGILSPGQGGVEIEGRNIAALSRKEIARHISLVPQEHMDVFPFKVLDVVVMGRAPFLGMTATPGEEDYRLAMDALKMLGCEKLADCNFNRISGGERQITLLATALVQTSKIMLLDEPTNHLDFNNQYRLLSRIKGLCRTRKTSVIATMHDPNMAMLFADRVIMVKNGGIVAKGSAKETMTTSNIDTLYGIKTVEIGRFDNKQFFLPESAFFDPDTEDGA